MGRIFYEFADLSFGGGRVTTVDDTTSMDGDQSGMRIICYGAGVRPPTEPRPRPAHQTPW